MSASGCLLNVQSWPSGSSNREGLWEDFGVRQVMLACSRAWHVGHESCALQFEEGSM